MHNFTSYDVTVEALCLYLNILQQKQTCSQIFHIQGETDSDPINSQRGLLLYTLQHQYKSFVQQLSLTI